MKKVLKIAGLFFFVVILALALIPVLFKDKLKQLILNEFARQTTATLYYADIDLSAFRSFPDLDLGIDEF